MKTTCFLSMENDEPLGIIVFDETGMSHVKLRDFFDESLIDLSTEMKLKYAMEFRLFLKKLEE